MRTAREAAIFVLRSGRLLLMHRAADGYWHVAAGVVEDGESFADAAARELREETGLTLPLTDLRMLQTYRVPAELSHEYAPDVSEVTIANFRVEAPDGWEPALNDEHDEHRWLEFADALALAHWPETSRVIAALAARETSAR